MHVSIRDGIIFAAEFPCLLDGLKALGLNSVELFFDRQDRIAALTTSQGQPFVSFREQSSRQRFQEQLEAADVTVCALCLSNDFSLPDVPAEIAWVIRASEAAKMLGAPVVRIDAYMKNATDWPLEKQFTHFAEAMKKILVAPEAEGTDFGIENHGAVGNNPHFLDAVLDAVGDQRLGMTLDTGNFYWSGKPLDEVHRILNHFVPYTKHTHVKNISYPAEVRNQHREAGWRYHDFACALPDGDIDLPSVVRTLHEAGYRRSLCIENESLRRYPPEVRKQMLLREADYLREILATIPP